MTHNASPRPVVVSEVLLRPDGTVYVHNLTPAMAQLLAELNPHDETLRRRATPTDQTPSPTNPLIRPTTDSSSPT